MRKRTFIRYLKLYFALVGIYFLLAATINWTVDPYNELGRNKVGLYFTTERQAKKAIVDFPHDAILIGNSKTGMIDPSTLHCYKFYNASFDGAMPEEIYLYLKRYLTNEKIVVIGLDFEMFNERQWAVQDIEDWPEHFFGPLEYLTSFRVTRHSLLGLHKKYVLEKPAIIAESGVRKEESVAMAGAASASLPDLPPGVYDYAEGLKILREHHFRRFLFSKQRMEYLDKIKNLLESREVNYAVFINPMNEEVQKLLLETGNHELFMRWREEIKMMFPQSGDFSTGRYEAKQYYKHARDPYHYKPGVGTEIINSLTNCEQRQTLLTK